MFQPLGLCVFPARAHRLCPLSCLHSADPTRVTVPPASMDVTVGESIVLTCQVRHDHSLDIVFTWSFNGHLIDFDRDGDHFERVGGVSVDARPPAGSAWDRPVSADSSVTRERSTESVFGRFCSSTYFKKLLVSCSVLLSSYKTRSANSRVWVETGCHK